MDKYIQLLGDLRHTFPKSSNLEINVTVPIEEIIKFSNECKRDMETSIVLRAETINPEGLFRSYKCFYGQINLIEENATEQQPLHR